MGTKMLKGTANKPATLETMDFSGIYSFVIHKNGDVRVASNYNGNYANYVHDHAQIWNVGWTLSDSASPDVGGILTLANDVPMRSNRPPIRCGFGDVSKIPFSLPRPLQGIHGHPLQRSGVSIMIITTTLLTSISAYTQYTSTYYWYVKYSTVTAAEFTASPLRGLDH
jgi:hypothetical protein